MIAEIRWELGNLYYDAERYGEAISAFQAALPDLVETLPSLHSDTYLALGHCYLLTRQHAKARDCYEEVLAHSGASTEQKATAQEGLSRLPSLRPPTVH
jgi:tetratricopeptide (TPR) repeat protein